MNANKIRIIAVVCLICFCVGVFAACKKKETDEQLVSVSTDENGSLYYTDPTYEVDGIEYGGETHFVKPEETNKNGEYKIGDVTSEPYTTNEHGEVAPVEDEDTTTLPSEKDTQKPSSDNNPTSSNPTDKPTEPTSGNSPTNPTNPTSPTNPTESETETSYAGIDDVVDGNNLNNDGVINAW